MPSICPVYESKDIALENLADGWHTGTAAELHDQLFRGGGRSNQSARGENKSILVVDHARQAIAGAESATVSIVRSSSDGIIVSDRFSSRLI